MSNVVCALRGGQGSLAVRLKAIERAKQRELPLTFLSIIDLKPFSDVEAHGELDAEIPVVRDDGMRKQHAIDYGLQVPHCALRAYVMGARGVENEPANADDIALAPGLRPRP